MCERQELYNLKRDYMHFKLNHNSGKTKMLIKTYVDGLVLNVR